jgi:hypothetical protein
MDNFIDLKILDVKQQMVDIINGSGLPITILEMILNELFSVVKEKRSLVIQEQRNIVEQKKKEKEEKSVSEYNEDKA